MKASGISSENRSGAEPRRILVNLLIPIGDTLFTTPALHGLRLAYPQAHIVALVYPSNAGVLETNPDVDEILVHPPPGQLQRWGEALRLFRELRARRFDLAVEMNQLGAPLSNLVAGIPRRVSLPMPPWWWLRSQRHRPWGQTHAVDHYLKVVGALGIQVKAPRLRFFLRSEDEAFAEEFLREHGVPLGQPLLALHAGGDGYGGRKRWPPQRYGELADRMARQHGATVLLLGAGHEWRLNERVAAAMARPAINAAGATSLPQAAALIARCQLFIGNDSSLLHIANALAVPAIGIYGPTNLAHFRPYQRGAKVVEPHIHCAPCCHFVGGAPPLRWPFCARLRCLEGITAETVAQSAAALLPAATTPPPEAKRQPLREVTTLSWTIPR